MMMDGGLRSAAAEAAATTVDSVGWTGSGSRQRPQKTREFARLSLMGPQGWISTDGVGGDDGWRPGEGRLVGIILIFMNDPFDRTHIQRAAANGNRNGRSENLPLGL